MRTHVHNSASETVFSITPEQWSRAVARLPDMADLQVTIASDDASFDTAMAEALDVGRLDGRVTDVAVPEPWSADDRLWRTRGMFVPPHMSSDDLATYNDNSLDILLPVLDRRGQGRVGSTRCSWIVVTERKSHAALLRKCHG